MRVNIQKLRVFIKKYQEEKELTQKELAKIFDVNPAYLSQIINGKISPSKALAEAIINIVDPQEEVKPIKQAVTKLPAVVIIEGVKVFLKWCNTEDEYCRVHALAEEYKHDFENKNQFKELILNELQNSAPTNQSKETLKFIELVKGMFFLKSGEIYRTHGSKKAYVRDGGYVNVEARLVPYGVLVSILKDGTMSTPPTEFKKYSYKYFNVEHRAKGRNVFIKRCKTEEEAEALRSIATKLKGKYESALQFRNLVIDAYNSTEGKPRSTKSPDKTLVYKSRKENLDKELKALVNSYKVFMIEASDLDLSYIPIVVEEKIKKELPIFIENKELGIVKIESDNSVYSGVVIRWNI
jgi:transcriptional regulator with XRE-family HTH domain